MLIALALALAGEVPEPLFDPLTGYRIAHYRAPVGEAPPGVTKIDDAEAAALADGRKVLLIDVTPAEGGQWDADRHSWRLSQPYRTISGAHWFPDAGRWPNAPSVEHWFDEGLDRLAHGRRGKLILVFCRADCWMSWNASWKVLRRGYKNVRWYPNGSDGFREMGRLMRTVMPER